MPIRSPLAVFPEAPGAKRVRHGASSLRSLGLFRWIVVVRVKFNRPDVTDTRPHSSDIHPALPQLIPPRTHGIVPGINRLTGRQQGEMPISRRAVIGKGV